MPRWISHQSTPAIRTCREPGRSWQGRVGEQVVPSFGETVQEQHRLRARVRGPADEIHDPFWRPRRQFLIRACGRIDPTDVEGRTDRFGEVHDIGLARIRVGNNRTARPLAIG